MVIKQKVADRKRKGEKNDKKCMRTECEVVIVLKTRLFHGQEEVSSEWETPKFWATPFTKLQLFTDF